MNGKTKKDLKKEGKKLSDEVQKVARLAQEYARISRASNLGTVTCVTCGKIGHYKGGGFHGGHFIPRSHWATIFEYINIHPQCIKCNKFNYGETGKYLQYMRDTYGSQKVEALIALSKTTKQWTIEELEVIKKELKQKIKQEEQRLSLFTKLQ